MSAIITLGALFFLMVVAYRGYSVILLAPVAAMLAVLLTAPPEVFPLFSGLFMAKMVAFLQLYFPIFMLGATFGKLIEISGFSKAIVSAAVHIVSPKRAITCIVFVCAILTYGGVPLFVVVFAVYPFAAELFRNAAIPKRLIPGAIALGSFSFTMDALPGTPQIQNIIPTTFFHTTTWAAPWLGVACSVFILTTGLVFLESRRRTAVAQGEGYGTGHRNEPDVTSGDAPISGAIAVLPLVVVAVVNGALTYFIPRFYGETHETFLPNMSQAITTQIRSVTAIWAVEGALICGIVTILIFRFSAVLRRFSEASGTAVAGALLSSMNTAAEYGFGAVLAILPGFNLIRGALQAIPNPLLNEAVTVSVLAGMTGSASGGLSIALASMSSRFIAAGQAAGIPMEVLHRVASTASGGMDTLPHNGAVITLLMVTGLTHRQSYGDIFAITCIKTCAVFFTIGVYYLTGVV